MHIAETELATLLTIGQTRVINAQQLHSALPDHRGVECVELGSGCLTLLVERAQIMAEHTEPRGIFDGMQADVAQHEDDDESVAHAWR